MCKTIKCAECATPFTPKRSTQAFCATQCKVQFHNRSGQRGRTVLPMLQAWRKVRGKGPTAKQAFMEACRQLDAWNAEDLKAGRAHPETFVARQFDGGLNGFYR